MVDSGERGGIDEELKMASLYRLIIQLRVQPMFLVSTRTNAGDRVF